MEKGKELTKQEISILEKDLIDKQSAKRRGAAKKIGKFIVTELGDALFEAYLKEKEDQRTWETQAEMIKALGRLEYKKLLPIVKEIVKENKALDALTMHAATAYVRLKRKKTQDVQPIYELFKDGKHSVLCGAVNTLAYDKIIPEEKEMPKLIKMVNESDHSRNPGVMDTREVLAAAMSQWPKELVAGHLEAYKKIRSISKDTIDYAMKGKIYYKEY